MNQDLIMFIISLFILFGMVGFAIIVSKSIRFANFIKNKLTKNKK